MSAGATLFETKAGALTLSHTHTCHTVGPTRTSNSIFVIFVDKISSPVPYPHHSNKTSQPKLNPLLTLPHKPHLDPQTG